MFCNNIFNSKYFAFKNNKFIKNWLISWFNTQTKNYKYKMKIISLNTKI